MKIIHVLTRLLRAGAEENTLACCFAQARNGHDVLLVHGHEHDQTLRASVTKVFPTITLEPLTPPLSPFCDLAAAQQLKRILRHWRPDIVHTHQSKAGIIGRLAARSANVPGIIHGVHILPFVHVSSAQRLLYLGAERLAARFTRAFIDVSHGMRDICLIHGIGTASQHHVVHSGFDLKRFSRATPPDDWQHLLGIAPGRPKPPVVLMLAALERRKRHIEFINAFTHVVSRIPDVRLILAGDGPERASIHAAIAGSPARENIRLVGYHSAPEQLIALADVCVLASMREGLPRVVMQYLAGGRSCVVSHLPGVEEIVRHGVNGLVTPTDDVSAAAAAVALVLENDAYRARLAAGAACTDLSSWDINVMCERVEEIYRFVMDTCGRQERSTSFQ